MRQLQILRQPRVDGDEQSYRFLLREEDPNDWGGTASTYYRSENPIEDRRRQGPQTVFDELDDRIREQFPSARVLGNWLYMSDADWVVLEMLADG